MNQAMCMNAIRVNGKGEWFHCQTVIDVPPGAKLDEIECPGCCRKGMFAPVVYVPKPHVP